MTRHRFLTKRQCVESIPVVDKQDVTRNRDISLDCACCADIVYSVGLNTTNAVQMVFDRPQVEGHCYRTANARTGARLLSQVIFRCFTDTGHYECSLVRFMYPKLPSI